MAKRFLGVCDECDVSRAEPAIRSGRRHAAESENAAPVTEVVPWWRHGESDSGRPRSEVTCRSYIIAAPRTPSRIPWNNISHGQSQRACQRIRRINEADLDFSLVRSQDPVPTIGTLGAGGRRTRFHRFPLDEATRAAVFSYLRSADTWIGMKINHVDSVFNLIVLLFIWIKSLVNGNDVGHFNRNRLAFLWVFLADVFSTRNSDSTVVATIFSILFDPISAVNVSCFHDFPDGDQPSP